MILRSVLPNGIRIVTESIDYVESASIGIWVGVGARDESERLSGISHVIEHMLFKGTATRSAKQIADEMDMIGGYLNAFTDKEYTCYYAKVLAENVADGLEILSDMFLNSVFDQEEFARERNVILEEIKQHQDEPDDLVHELFLETIWPNHVLGRPIIGTTETVSGLERDDLLEYIAKQYTPDTIVIAAAGRVQHEQIVEMVADRFGGLIGKQSDWRRPETAPESIVATRTVSKPTEQTQLVLGVPGYTQYDDRRYALSLLDIAVGGGMSSRLFQEIREKRGLAYSVGTYASTFREGGTFAVYAGTSPDTAQEVIDLIHAEFNKLRVDNITEIELQRAKNQVRGGMLMGQESMSNRMTRMGKSEIVYDRVIPLEEIMQKINAVTLCDTHAIAADLLGADTFTVAQVGPFEE